MSNTPPEPSKTATFHLFDGAEDCPRRPGLRLIVLRLHRDNPHWGGKRVLAEAKREWHTINDRNATR